MFMVLENGRGDESAPAASRLAKWDEIDSGKPFIHGSGIESALPYNGRGEIACPVILPHCIYQGRKVSKSAKGRSRIPSRDVQDRSVPI
jgi:hypothetical protein